MIDLEKTKTTAPKVVYLSVHLSIDECEPRQKFRAFSTREQANEYNRTLIDSVLADWQRAFKDIVPYDIALVDQDDAVFYDRYDNDNAIYIYVNHREYENSDSIFIQELVVE